MRGQVAKQNLYERVAPYVGRSEAKSMNMWRQIFLWIFSSICSEIGVEMGSAYRSCETRSILECTPAKLLICTFDTQCRFSSAESESELPLALDSGTCVVLGRLVFGRIDLFPRCLCRMLHCDKLLTPAKTPQTAESLSHCDCYRSRVFSDCLAFLSFFLLFEIQSILL